jgi:hypothetical protein
MVGEADPRSRSATRSVQREGARGWRVGPLLLTVLNSMQLEVAAHLQSRFYAGSINKKWPLVESRFLQFVCLKHRSNIPNHHGLSPILIHISDHFAEQRDSIQGVLEKDN